MTREIKFRAWDGKKMYYWDSVDHQATHLITNTPDKKLFYLPMSWLLGDSNDWVWMQDTGLKDKNGKEIYDGDWIKGQYREGKVHSKNGGFYCWDELLYESVTEDEVEIIGNIYESRHLLENIDTKA